MFSLIKLILGIFHFLILQWVRLFKYITTFTPEKEVFLVGKYVPVKDELTIEDMKITEGFIPKDITGKATYTFLTVMVCYSIHISNGKVKYMNKFIQTEKLITEKKAGKALIFGFKHALDPYAVILHRIEKFLYKHNLDPIPQVSNTSVVFHAGKLLTLAEGDLAYRVDENKLDTVGKFNFDSKWKQAITAHPKKDPITGELIFFGYDMMNSGIQYGISDKEGNLTHQRYFKIDFPTMIHDFAVTSKHTIFMIHPLVLNLEGFFTGTAGFNFIKEKESVFHIAPRYWKDQNEFIQFRTKGHFIFHTGNAYEEGDEIIMTACKYADELKVLRNAFVLENSELEDIGTMVNLVKFRFNMKTKEVKEELFFSDLSLEFPVINPNYVGIPNRYTYLTCSNKPGLLKFDDKTGESKMFLFDQGYDCGEAIFAPKEKATREDDGYLMTFVYHDKTDSSTFEIFDAVEMKRISKVAMPRRVPSGFHGTWIPK